MENYKEKYEKALKDIKKIKAANKDNKALVDFIEYEYPALKESEDEEIRNFINNELTFLRALDSIDSDRYKEITNAIAWLEKQGMKETKKTSIWNHWKDGIAGNGEGKLIYLIKDGNDYSLNSVLGRECDYILLSDLDKLMLEEKQGEQKTAEWSEEDEEHLNSILERLEGMCKKGATFTRTRFAVSEDKDWLKSLRPQPKYEWSEEDERIRKNCIHFLKLQKTHHAATFEIDECIAWLEKQGKQEQLYIRFGEIPTDEKSKIYQGEIEVGTENGVSVYPAFKTDKGDIVLGLSLPITKTTLYTQQHLIEYDDRPCYLVKGDYVGKDTDGQPLINNVSIIKKIDSYRVK